jgi:hypothetical protein
MLSLAIKPAAPNASFASTQKRTFAKLSVLGLGVV